MIRQTLIDHKTILGGTGCNPVRAQRAGGLSCSERRRAMPPTSTFQKLRITFKPDAPNSVTSCCLTTTPDYIRGHPGRYEKIGSRSLLQQNRLLTIRSHGNNLHGFADDFLDCLDISNCIFRQIFHFTNAGNVFLPACNGPIHGF